MSHATVPAVVLAGGRSSRMGQPKALLPAGAETFVGRIARTLRAGGAAGLVVVAPTADLAARIGAALAGLAPPPRVVVNPDPDRGQLSSLLVGLDELERGAGDRRRVDAALVTLVDVPLATAATVRALLDRYRRTRAPVVRPARADRPGHGHPVLFGRALFAELRRADPAAGAKPVVRAHEAEAEDVVVDDPGAFTDIDTPDDYRRAFGAPPPDRTAPDDALPAPRRPPADAPRR